MTRILVADDDHDHLEHTTRSLIEAGYEPIRAAGGEAAVRMLTEDRGIAAALVDLVMPEIDGIGVLDALRARQIDTPVLIQALSPSLEIVTTLANKGAADVLDKPTATPRLAMSLRMALSRVGYTRALGAAPDAAGAPVLAEPYSAAAAMERPLALCASAGRSPLPVLIEGEPGVGKFTLATRIHRASERGGRPLVRFSCGHHAPGDIEAALFGTNERPGAAQAAEGGTLVIEEVGDLPAVSQTRLLGLLTTGMTGNLSLRGRAEKLDLRVIATTTRRLLNLARAGTVREDLYYRLNVMPIYVPPLRERAPDIALYANRFCARFAAETGRPLSGLSGSALALLDDYAWPGNLRQLERMIYRAVVLSEAERLEIADFPQIVSDMSGREAALLSLDALPDPGAPVHIDAAPVAAARPAPIPAESGQDRFLDGEGQVKSLSRIERELIEFAISRHAGRMARVARTLAIGRSTLYRKLGDYGFSSDTDAA